MKKITAILLSLLIMLAFPCGILASVAPDSTTTATIFAETDAESPLDQAVYANQAWVKLYNTWECKYGYSKCPDYIGGWWTDAEGYLHIALADEAGRAEILEILGEDEVLLIFESVKYSLNELLAIAEEVKVMGGKNENYSGIFVFNYENAVHVYFSCDEGDSSVQNFVNECTEKYGDAVKFSYGIVAEDIKIVGGGNIIYNDFHDTTGTIDIGYGVDEKNSFGLWFVTVILAVCVCSLFFVWKRKSALALRTSTGETVTTGKISFAETEKMAAQNLDTSASLDIRIAEDIKDL